jgi:hypothetical protein
MGGAVRPGLKTIDDARALRERLLPVCELAERNESDEGRQRRLTTVIIGGGATGVEMAALSPSYCGGLRMPILPLMEAIVVRASDRHCQLPSYLHSATIFSRLLLIRMRQN